MKEFCLCIILSLLIAYCNYIGIANLSIPLLLAYSLALCINGMLILFLVLIGVIKLFD